MAEQQVVQEELLTEPTHASQMEEEVRLVFQHAEMVLL